MSKIHITCPACRNTLAIDAAHEGEEVQCGACQEVFVARPEPSPAGAGGTFPATAGESGSSTRSRRRRDEIDRDHDEGYDDALRERRTYRPDERKSRLAYIMLALFLGYLGVHNFYAGRTGSGIAQLAITVASVPLMCVGVGFVTIWIPWVWAIIDIIVIDRDSNNIPMTT